MTLLFYNHSRTDNANQTKQHGYEKYKPYPPWKTLHPVWKYVTIGSQQRKKKLSMAQRQGDPSI
jgi:hypothetical protein